MVAMVGAKVDSCHVESSKPFWFDEHHIFCRPGPPRNSQFLVYRNDGTSRADGDEFILRMLSSSQKITLPTNSFGPYLFAAWMTWELRILDRSWYCLCICNKIVLQNVQADSGSNAVQVVHESDYVVIWDDCEARNVADVERKATRGSGHVNSKVQKSHTPYTAYCKQLRKAIYLVNASLSAQLILVFALSCCRWYVVH